jgi:putative transposase
MAKTEHYYTKFEAGNYYHVYNRTVDLKPLFKNEGNYLFFLRKYAEYLSAVVETHAYCLLGNHFHLLIRIKTMDELLVFREQQKAAKLAAQDMVTVDLTTFEKLSNLALPNLPPPNPKPDTTAYDIVSHQFQKFFQSYAMAFNKQHDRVGTLFQTPFKRVLIDDDNYLTNMVYYVHANPQKHGLIDDFRDWKWSSYHSFLSEMPTSLCRDEVLTWFGGLEKFVEYHAIYQTRLRDMGKYDIED